MLGVLTVGAKAMTVHEGELMTTAAAAPEQLDAEKAGGFRALIPGLLRDIALPTIAYYALHWLGYSDWIALLGGSITSAAILTYEAVRTRRFEVFSAFIMGIFAISLITSLVTGDARFLLLKESIGTSIMGLAFLISIWSKTPLIYLSARRMMAANPAALAGFEAKYRSTPGMRDTMRRMSAMWGVGLLAEAIIRIPLVYALPIDVMAIVSPVMMVGTIVLLVVIGKKYVKRVKARARG
jgi:hypothetical protein